ncbi:MAG: DivIVA domain-containing protein [Oscillospiraceae bacterium]|nr:DivIVA domain-containing protein [Oscillospiraceae bacterium]
MGAKEILAKKFEMVLRGYKTEEVEEFLREVSLDFSKLQKENENLEKKLDVLADKIREYREDEDTLKDALLGAQRQGNALIADSKRKAAEVVEEAQSNSAAILKKAEEDRQKLKEKGASEIAAAREEARTIIENANEKAADIEREMNLRTDVQKEILHRTTSEVLNFKARIISNYKEQMAIVEKIVDDCENEFIKKTLKEGRPDFKSYSPSDKKNKERRNKGKTQQIPAMSEKDSKAAGGESDSDDGDDGMVVEINAPVQFEVDVSSDNTEEIPLFKSDENGNNKVGEIFFKKNDSKQKGQNGRNKQRLHFGGNNDN